jgi:phosphate transport system protein
MPKRFHRELEKIKKRILSLGALVEDRVHKVISAIETRDIGIVRWVVESDPEIDAIEVEIEEECLKIMALHQPVAVDLRFLVAVIKINNDLERIADEAVNIAERLTIVLRHPRQEFTFDSSMMAGKAERLLKMSLDSLVNLDLNLAREVISLDDEIDQLDHLAYDEIKEAMKKNPTYMGYWINLFSVSRHIERIADHAVNIAEEVIYLIEGEIVRHGFCKVP